jgi:2-oxoisovalerate dehydrogenase E1 component
MPKSQFVDPNILRSPGFISFTDIPVNQYKKTIADERANYTDEQLMNVYADMVFCREYETMINLIKTTSEYNGVAYSHPGPAHLSMGQEASAVGQALVLDTDDYSFGSHRSHGEVLARGLSAIRKLPNDRLLEIMKTYNDGVIYKIIEKEFKNVTDTKLFATYFFLYGAMAEMFARETGFQKGLGGSMHAFFTPFGIYPNNAIVGGSADIAVGAALYKRINRQPGIVIANIGDGALGCGPVWEALCMATMDQYKQLWEGDMKGGLPFLFNIFNNQYGMGGQTRGETMGYDFPARLGAGITPNQMLSERVDGYNPLAVADATLRQKQAILERRGPAMLDVVTYRFAGHSPSDSSSYREKAEVEAWQEHDPLLTYRKALIEAGLAKDSKFEDILAKTKDELTHILKIATDVEISPRMNLIANPNQIGDLMFSNQKIAAMRDAQPDVLGPKESSPRVQQIAKKERFGIGADGKPVSKNKVFNIRDGIFESIIDKYYEDPTLISYGEDVRDWGGAFAVYRGLTEVIPYHRLFNSPISEGAIVGAATGYAMAGGRVIGEIMYCDFLGRCGDELFNQLPKWQAMSAGSLTMPVVIRVSVGSKYGAQHSQDWTSLCGHIPGLKVCFPATPYDAKGLMASALEGTDPVIFFESQRIYDMGELFHEGGVPTEKYYIEIGEPDVKRVGKDVTILSIGSTLYRAVKAADMLKEKYNLEAELIDARSINPFNYDKVIESVKKTGRILLTSDACERGSFLKDMAQSISELAFDYLDAPPVVVGARNWITPAHEIEDFFFPQPEWMLDAINEKILPLPGHVATANFTANEQLRRAREGV